MSSFPQDASRPDPSTFNSREAMERLNQDAAHLHIWIRTQANQPAQAPWCHDAARGLMGDTTSGRVGAGQLKALAHRWSWTEIAPYLDRIASIARSADVSPLEFAERQQLLLVNPGFAGRLQIGNSIRCAVSIYNPGDRAPVHVHTPNASRTILSEGGGYTTVDGERCDTHRGDLILTPSGAWHGHGNDGSEATVWVDVLDWPLLEFLDCIWLDRAEPTGESTGVTGTPSGPVRESARMYGYGGMLPGFASHRHDIGCDYTPMVHYQGDKIRDALRALRDQIGDPYEGITIKFVNPTTGGPIFPTLDYSAILLRPGEETQLKRETSSTLFIVMEGHGTTEVGGKPLNWEVNDILVAPSFLWRRHINRGETDAILYAISDRALMQKIGQYRAQGRLSSGGAVDVSS